MADRRPEDTMNCYHTEPRLSEIMSDSIIRTIMAADHVNPETLEACLRKTAQRVSGSATAERNA
jgi:hypothetical protein